VTQPNGGMGGMVTKPWSERTKTTQQLLMESMGPLSKIAGVRVIRRHRPLPGGGSFPVDLVIASAARAEAAGSRWRSSWCRRRFASGLFIYADADLKFDQPQTEVVFDSRQAAFAGRRSQSG